MKFMEAISSLPKKRNLSSDEMKKSTFRKLIDKSLRFHHQDIHEELGKIELRKQIKSRFYYIFWGAATFAVVLGQLHVASGYKEMTKGINALTYSLSRVVR